MARRWRGRERRAGRGGGRGGREIGYGRAGHARARYLRAGYEGGAPGRVYGRDYGREYGRERPGRRYGRGYREREAEVSADRCRLPMPRGGARWAERAGFHREWHGEPVWPVAEGWPGPERWWHAIGPEPREDYVWEYEAGDPERYGWPGETGRG